MWHFDWIILEQEYKTRTRQFVTVRPDIIAKIIPPPKPDPHCQV